MSSVSPFDRLCAAVSQAMHPPPPPPPPLEPYQFDTLAQCSLIFCCLAPPEGGQGPRATTAACAMLRSEEIRFESGREASWRVAASTQGHYSYHAVLYGREEPVFGVVRVAEDEDVLEDKQRRQSADGRALQGVCLSLI